jgi:hypothetical protein
MGGSFFDAAMSLEGIALIQIESLYISNKDGRPHENNPFQCRLGI